MRPLPLAARTARAARAVRAVRAVRATRGLAPLVVATCLLASPAEAQLGKFVKRAAQAAAEAAAGATVRDAAGGAVSGAVGDTPGTAPGESVGRKKVDANQLEITAERLDAFVVAMRGPAAAARRRAEQRAAREAWEAEQKEYTERDDAYDACKDRVTEGRTPDMSPAAVQRIVPVMERFQKANERAGAAYAAGNTALATQLADSVELLAAEVEAAQFPEVAKRCGRPPRKPARAPAEETVDARAFRPALPAGMTPIQFGVLRERVAAWLVVGGQYVSYTEAERQALESRRAALAPLAPFFSGRQLDWTDVLGGLRGHA
jgi:hypothetical protein